MKPAAGDERSERYRPLSGRRRLLIALLAICTAVAVVLTLLAPPGGVQRKRPPSAAATTASMPEVAPVMVVPAASGVSGVTLPPLPGSAAAR